MTAKRLCRAGQLALAWVGLALVIIPNGMRFTGYFLLGCLGVWIAGELLASWSKTSRAGKVCLRVFAFGLALGLAGLISIEILLLRYGEADNSALPVDAVIVLGAGVNGEIPSAALHSRIQAAASYLALHEDVQAIVLSGGQGPGENISEAEAMRRALWTNSEERNSRYVIEDQSRNTAENFRFSTELLEARGVDTETAVIAVVTNDFHCFRAHMIAQDLGLTVVDVPAELPWWWLTANYYLREAFAVVKTAVFDLT